MPLDSTNWAPPAVEVVAPDSDAVRVLLRARRLIEHGWTKGTYARFLWIFPVPETAPIATQFCTIGAIRRAAIVEDVHRRDALNLFNSVIPNFGIVEWNDIECRRKRAVLRGFDRAIALGRQQSQP